MIDLIYGFAVGAFAFGHPVAGVVASILGTLLACLQVATCGWPTDNQE